jgi:hypothetical protein
MQSVQLHLAGQPGRPVLIEGALMKKQFLFLALMLVSLFVSEPYVALAQTTWTVTFDFRFNNGGFSTAPADTPFGVWIGGQGWKTETKPVVGHDCDLTRIYAELDFDHSTTITDAEMTYSTYDGGDSGGAKSVYVSKSISDFRLVGDFDFASGDNQTISEHGLTYTADKLWLFSAIDHDACAIPGAYAIINKLVISGTGDAPLDSPPASGPYKPVSGPDVYLNDASATDHAIINTRQNANAHIVTNSTIIAVYQVGGAWGVAVQPDYSSSVTDAMIYAPLQGVNGSVGDIVAAGCVIGQIGDGVNPSAGPPIGQLTFTAAPDVVANWQTYDDSPIDTPCDASKYLTENCLNINPNFADDAKNWNVNGNASYHDSTFWLAPNSNIYQDVVLDPETPYYITIYASLQDILDTRSADFVAALGDTQATMHVGLQSTGQFVQIKSQALSLGSPSFSGNNYTFTIHGLVSHGAGLSPNLLIRFACVSTGDVATTPSGCYWADPRLTTDLWTHDESVTYNPPLVLVRPNGEYEIPNASEITYPVDISSFSGSDTGFKLSMAVVPKAFTGAPLLPPYGRVHAYIRDPDTSDVLVDIGTEDLSLADISLRTTLPFTLTTGQHIVGDLVIANESGDISSDSGWTLVISAPCMTVDGGVWPGYTNTDTNGNLLGQDCTAVNPPQNPETVTVTDYATLAAWFGVMFRWSTGWLSYGLALIHYVLFCIIVGIINNIWGAVLGVMAGLGLFGKWIGLVVTALATWGRDGARFLFNNLVASLIPLFNLLITWLLSLPFIQGLIDTAGLAAFWLDALFQIVLGVFNLFLLAIQFLAALLNLIGVAWAAFLSGMTATPISIFPFPNCSDSGSALYDACLPLDVVNFIAIQLPVLIALIDAAAFAVFWRQGRKVIKATREAFES